MVSVSILILNNGRNGRFDHFVELKTHHSIKFVKPEKRTVFLWFLKNTAYKMFVPDTYCTKIAIFIIFLIFNIFYLSVITMHTNKILYLNITLNYHKNSQKTTIKQRIQFVTVF